VLFGGPLHPGSVAEIICVLGFSAFVPHHPYCLCVWRERATVRHFKCYVAVFRNWPDCIEAGVSAQHRVRTRYCRYLNFRQCDWNRQIEPFRKCRLAVGSGCGPAPTLDLVGADPTASQFKAVESPCRRPRCRLFGRPVVASPTVVRSSPGRRSWLRHAVPSSRPPRQCQVRATTGFIRSVVRSKARSKACARREPDRGRRDLLRAAQFRGGPSPPWHTPPSRR
jgi:hypothetical protein